MKESLICLYNRVIFIGQFRWFLRIKSLKIYALVWKSSIDFNEAFIPYNELQF